MLPGMAGDLMTALQQPLHQLGAVGYAALCILFEIGVMVVGGTAPGGSTLLARSVGIVPLGIAYYVKGALGVVLL